MIPWFIYVSCIIERSSTTPLFSLAKSPLTHCCTKCNRTRTFLQQIPLMPFLYFLQTAAFRAHPAVSGLWLVGFGHMGSWEQSRFRLEDCKYPQLFTDRERKVMFSQVFVYNPPHGYSFTPHPCYCTVSTHPTGMLSCFYRNVAMKGSWPHNAVVNKIDTYY